MLLHKPRADISRKFFLFVAFIVTARMSFIGGSDITVALWVVGWASLILLLMDRFTIALLLLLFLILFPQSLWFTFDSYGHAEILTIYERELFYFKPIEILLSAALIKILLFDNRKFITPDKRTFIVFLFWLVAIASGISVALFNNVPFYDMFIFSEFRTISLGLLFLLVIINCIEHKIIEFFSWVLLFVLAKMFIAIVEYIFGVALLWSSVAKSYAGGVNAMFGGDPDVAILVFGFSFVVVSLLYTKGYFRGVIGHRHKLDFDPNRLFDNQKLQRIVLLLAVTGVILSFRRGGALSLVVVMGGIFLLEPMTKKVLISAVVVFVATFMVVDYSFNIGIMPDAVHLLFDRLLGIDESAQKSDYGHLQDIYDSWARIQDNYVFGSGVGSRLELARVEAWGVKTEQLAVHQGTLHTWFKYGIAGVLAYYLTFLLGIRNGLRVLKVYHNNLDYRVQVIVLGMVLFLAASFMWEQTTPPFFQNFRRTALVMLAIGVTVLAGKLGRANWQKNNGLQKTP